MWLINKFTHTPIHSHSMKNGNVQNVEPNSVECLQFLLSTCMFIALWRAIETRTETKRKQTFENMQNEMFCISIDCVVFCRPMKMKYFPLVASIICVRLLLSCGKLILVFTYERHFQ